MDTRSTSIFIAVVFAFVGALSGIITYVGFCSAKKLQRSAADPERGLLIPLETPRYVGRSFAGAILGAEMVILGVAGAVLNPPASTRPVDLIIPIAAPLIVILCLVGCIGLREVSVVRRVRHVPVPAWVSEALTVGGMLFVLLTYATVRPMF